jgi:protocatechuate 3,4-dioxygenase beta subunit
VDHGLPHDLAEIELRLASRRRLLGWLVSAGTAPLLGCDGLAPAMNTGVAADAASDAALSGSPLADASGVGGGSAQPHDAGSATGGNSEAGTNPDGGTCTATPSETGGPFPADSVIGPNVLVRNGIVRSDIRSSFAVGSATAAGLELRITLTVLDGQSCRPRPGAVVYLWHCDREGRYSLYSPGVTEQDYLRGAQQADEHGNVTFITIFPGCYPGRWPHMHFEVFENAAVATTAGSVPLLTSQLAFLESDCELAYGAAGYEASVSNLQLLSLQTDGVFRDGFQQQLATVTGSVASGLVATFPVTT